MHNKPNQPQTGDVVIWDVEPQRTSPIYSVRTQDPGSATQLFEGPGAWVQAWSAAEERAGPEAPSGCATKMAMSRDSLGREIDARILRALPSE